MFHPFDQVLDDEGADEKPSVIGGLYVTNDGGIVPFCIEPEADEGHEKASSEHEEG